MKSEQEIVTELRRCFPSLVHFAEGGGRDLASIALHFYLQGYDEGQRDQISVDYARTMKNIGGVLSALVERSIPERHPIDLKAFQEWWVRVQGEIRKNPEHVLSGRDLGKAARHHFILDQFEDEGACFEVLIPSDLIALTDSFFIGMFAPSVRKLKSAFLERYKFKNQAMIDIEQTIKSGMEWCLKNE